MAFNNLLQMKPILRGSGTISEISSTSGKGSVFGDTEEDLLELVSILSLNSIDELCCERFRIDRKKLEYMLGSEDAPAYAENFFQKIMDETRTRIAWPCKLKVGSKSKKNPHVRVAGRPHDVAVAKERILSRLEIKNSRVTMKIDVSYTDHSHIIGKCGKTIKQVMDETKCHIHFPDSNRTNPLEKSNQVSITGDIRGVEIARARVRKITPLIFSFEMPIISCYQTPPDVNSPYISHISQQYNVHVMFRSQSKLHATLVMVKGSDSEVHKVKEATILLIKHICDTASSEVLVQMSMEISPIHHPIVRGKGSIHIKNIMQNTGTQIMFPEVSDPNIAPIKKSNVIITGGIDNVYLARQQLLGSLPLILLFDLPENIREIKSERIAHLMSTLDVFINVRQKPKQNLLGVTIKGIERNVSNIYEARHQLLGLNEPPFIAQIPFTYFMRDVPMTFTSDYTANNASQLAVHSPQNVCQSTAGSTWGHSNGQYQSNPAPLSPFFLDNSNYYQQELDGEKPLNTGNTLSTILTNSQASSYSSSNRYYYNSNQSEVNTTVSASNGSQMLQDQLEGANGNKDSGFISGSSSYRHSLSPINTPRNSPSPMPDTSTGIVLSSMLSNISREPLIKPALHTLPYDQQRLAAWQATHSPISGYRVPNNIWSGYGFSATSPGALKSDSDSTRNIKEEDIWPTSSTSTMNFKHSANMNSPSSSNDHLDVSNLLDELTLASVQTLTSCEWVDLATMLTTFGLEKYLKIFKEHDIDLAIFRTLTDGDLLEIGVTSFGARRKMLILITELKKRSATFSGSFAPGAERKNSSASGSSKSPNQGW